MREVAEARGVSIGDEGIAEVIDAMVRWLEASSSVKRVLASKKVLREKVVTVMRKHFDFDRVDEAPRRKVEFSEPLVMTSPRQTAIELLRLSHAEPLEQVELEMEQNPLLEEAEETFDASETSERK
jgi:hypothetical protein